jgi:hypothetical protein
VPGIFGSIAAAPHAAALLALEFRKTWPGAEFIEKGSCRLGSHAFVPHQALFSARNGMLIGVDGEWALYRDAAACLPDHPELLDRQCDEPERSASVGTVCVLDPREERLRIATDATGTFPLYYTRLAGGLLFSSLIRPLATAIGARRDSLAALEFLRQGYIVGPKTLFEGVFRLLPGQAIVATRDEFTVLERSMAWAEEPFAPRDGAEHLAWDRLVDAARRSVPSERAALMMSGGWDSRTLLGAAAAVGSRPDCYCHGDLHSRELRIVEALCEASGVSCHLEPIDDRVLDPAQLARGFSATENVVFPHWHRAGQVLGQMGVACAAAGVYGEVLGGHYGPAMLAADPVRKALDIASLLVFERPISARADADAARRILSVRHLGTHWYLQREWEDAIGATLPRLNSEIEGAIARFRRRGVSSEAEIVEAFITEHRGTQYINAQLLSLRSHLDVALPFGRGELFPFATRISLGARVHNALSRRMLAKNAPGLLRHPLAATLLPARAPILAQEASRAVRKLYHGVAKRRWPWPSGTARGSHLGWVNFEFLRSGHALHCLIDDLQCDHWDISAMHARVTALHSNAISAPHPLYDQFMKVYTLDMLWA